MPKTLMPDTVKAEVAQKYREGSTVGELREQYHEYGYTVQGLINVITGHGVKMRPALFRSSRTSGLTGDFLNRDLERVGSVIQAARLAQNCTQARLADEIGNCVQYVSALENGRCDIKFSALRRIVAVLGIDPTSLFPADEAPDVTGIKLHLPLPPREDRGARHHVVSVRMPQSSEDSPTGILDCGHEITLKPDQRGGYSCISGCKQCGEHNVPSEFSGYLG